MEWASFLCENGPFHSGLVDHGHIISPLFRYQIGILRDFLNDTLVMAEILGPDFRAEIYSSRGEFLQGLLDQCLQSPKLPGQIREIIQYITYRGIPTNGLASTPTNFSGVLRSEKRHLDLNSAFQALDMKRVNDANLVHAVNDVKSWFARDLQSKVHLIGFDVFKYNTRGEVLRSLLEHLESFNGQPEIPQETKENIRKGTWRPLSLNGSITVFLGQWRQLRSSVIAALPNETFKIVRRKGYRLESKFQGSWSEHNRPPRTGQSAVLPATRENACCKGAARLSERATKIE
uniref:Uncharacterized protein n=1 Tax=Timema poppense TaxID=170557 RepID=A0A7R9GXK5_TIMPO|nr:unnamed protein product [Timema poppensis]